MNNKLIDRLAQYEQNTPISNDRELIKAFDYIIEEEVSLPVDDRDFKLIDDAIKLTMELRGIDAEELNAVAEVVIDGAIENARKSCSCCDNSMTE